MGKIKLNKDYSIGRITPKDGHYFFGYYNICPWNRKGNKILACKANFINKNPNKTDLLTIGYMENNNFIEIDKTSSWNWQQGCMLQWIPNNKNKIIYNKKEKKKFISVIYDIKSKKRKKISFPIYSIHPSGKYAISLNFARLNDTRKGYGYGGIDDEHKNKKTPKKDGVYLIDLKKNTTKLIISIEKLSGMIPEESMKFGKHWVNHLSFNDSGDKFCFFYRWELPCGLFNTRLIVSDFSGKKIKILANGGEFSHVEWINNENLLGWGSTSTYIKKIKSNTRATRIFFDKIRPIIKILISKKMRNKITKQGYLLFNNVNNKITKTRLFNEDGHPSISPNKHFIITDTYASKKHFRKLLLYDIRNKKKTILGKFYSLPDKKYSNDKTWDNSRLRCDLHPRWDRNGKSISFDSVHEGFRGIYRIGPDFS